MIQGHMYSEQWTMLNIYAANIDDHLFIQNVFLQIAQSSGSFLVGGDFNFCLDNVLDRSSTRPLPLSKAAISTTAFMKDLNLTDVWRHEHPQVRDYSFYSHPHDTHTRIDYFLLSTQLLYCVLDVEYLPRLLSDHSPLVMSLSIPEKTGRTYRWRLNPILLKQSEFQKFVREQIDIFTSTNKPSCSNSFILWDTLKAYLRGHCITYTKGLIKSKKSKLNELESEISALEKIYHTDQKKDVYRELLNKKLEYNKMNTYQAEKAIISSN